MLAESDRVQYGETDGVLGADHGLPGTRPEPVRRRPHNMSAGDSHAVRDPAGSDPVSGADHELPAPNVLPGERSRVPDPVSSRGGRDLLSWARDPNCVPGVQSYLLRRGTHRLSQPRDNLCSVSQP